MPEDLTNYLPLLFGTQMIPRWYPDAGGDSRSEPKERPVPLELAEDHNVRRQRTRRVSCEETHALAAAL